MAKSLMIQGTMSNAGKSLITAGLCRIFKQDGYKVVPFKSQNMALNSYITKDGFEMGRAQVIQAEACGVEPSVLMNPILLKPTNDVGSQIIVNGEVVGHMSASEYFKHKKELVPDILKAFNTLSNENDIVVIEGAGSPAEINLKSEDIVNMGMAKMADAPVLLVGDIDRGGVFASLYGTVELLEDDERARIKGLIINKFRGDVEILKPGLKMLEDLTGIPVVGVVPYSHLDIEDEDSLAPRLSEEKKKKIIDIAVIRLPRIANFTDFNSLERFPQVSVRYVESHNELQNPDLIILPGTKNTMEDLLWLRQNGLEAKILKLNGSGIPVIGICGGYQMLGEKLCDPNNIEHGGELRGLGILPVETVFKDNKTRTRVNGKTEKIEGFFSKLSEKDFVGYEIHMGVTSVKGECLSTLNMGSCKAQDGCIKGNVLGSYVHGIFDEGTFAESLISLLLEIKGYTFEQASNINYNDYRMQQYDKLAEVLRSSLDMDKIYSIVNIEKEDL